MTDRQFAVFCAALTALFWGLYGPAVSLGRSPTNAWTPYKPYLFIGVAYLVWGCIGGALGMKAFGDGFSFGGSHFPAAKWGFLGGSLGAFGALALTTALLKSKGDVHMVMPIVFGGAVTVSAITNYFMMTDRSHVSANVWLGMGVVLLGILIVTFNAPHAVPKKPGASTPTPSPPVGDAAPKAAASADK